MPAHEHDWQPCDVASHDDEVHPGVECDGCQTVCDLVYETDPREDQ